MTATRTTAPTGAVPLLLGLAMLADAAMVPLVPFALATRLGWPLGLVGAYSSAVMAVTMVVTHQVSARVDASTGRARMCLLSALCQICGALAAIGAVEGAGGLLVLTAVGTAFGGAVAPVYYTLGRLLAPGDPRGSTAINARLRAITSAAWMAGPAVAFAVTGTVGIAAAFGVVAAIAGTGALAVLVAGRGLDESAREAATAASAVAAAAPTGAGRDDHRTGALHGSRARLIAVGVVFLFSFAHIATASSLALLLVRRFDIPEAATGLLLGLKAAAEMIAILVTPALAARLLPRTVLTLAGTGAACAYVAYLLGHGLGGAVVATVLEGGSYGLFAVTALTWIPSLAGAGIGRATGLYMNGIYAGVLIGAPVSGLVASWRLEAISALSLAAAVTAVIVLRVAPGDRR